MPASNEAHWRLGLDEKPYLYHYDLPEDRDVVVTIERVEHTMLVGKGGKKTAAWLLYFVGKKKPLGVKATNCTAIEKVSGSDKPAKWVGVRISLYVTTTRGEEGGVVKCIRVREQPPRDTAPAKGAGDAR